MNFGPWINFNGSVCPVEPETLVKVQLGDNLALEAQCAKNINWDKGVVTAYRIQDNSNKTDEEKFYLVLLNNDFSQQNPFSKFNIDSLNFDAIVQQYPTVYKDFILFTYARLEELPCLDPEEMVSQLYQLNQWLKVKEICSYLMTAYQKLNISISFNSLPFSTTTLQYLFDDLRDGIDNVLEDYITSIEDAFKDYLNYKD